MCKLSVNSVNGCSHVRSFHKLSSRLGQFANIVPRLVMGALVSLVVSGCVHPLAVKNIGDYESYAPVSLDKQLVVGIRANGPSHKPESKLISEAVNYLYKANVKPIYPYSSGAQGNNKVDVIAEFNLTSEYSGSGWNFLINFPGFLLFAPAWNGYVYKADYNFDCRLMKPGDNSLIEKWDVPIHLNIRHADLDRTWTEVSWLEVGIIAFVGGVCFIQYDDDVTPLVINQTRSTLGEYLSSQLVQHLKKLDIESSVVSSPAPAADPNVKLVKNLQAIDELLKLGLITVDEHKNKREALLNESLVK